VPLYTVPTVAFGGEDRVSVVVAGATVRVTGPVVIATGLLVSVAFTVRFEVPATDGVPLTTQFVIDNPAGSVPLVMVHEYGEVPPFTPMVPLYGVPTVAFGGEVRVRVIVAGSTVRLTGPVVVSTVGLESVALTVRFAVPATVGVPLTTQPEIERPAGSTPAVMVQE
jgi:hypothetical protein